MAVLDIDNAASTVMARLVRSMCGWLCSYDEATFDDCWLLSAIDWLNKAGTLVFK